MIENQGNKNWRCNKYSYRQVCDYAKVIEETYKINNTNINPSSDLASYISAAKELDNWWTLKAIMPPTFPIPDEENLWKALECVRIGSSFEILKNDENLIRYLRDLSKGDLSPLDSKQTIAKNKVFELELARLLKLVGGRVSLSEPDIIFEYKEHKCGIAAKKVYSTKNLDKIYKDARKQIIRQIIEGRCDKGIIALSIDSLFPINGPKELPTPEDISYSLDQEITKFIRTYESKFKLWAKHKKIIATMVTFSRFAVDKENLTYYAMQMGINPLCSKSSPYFDYIEEINKDFQNKLVI